MLRAASHAKEMLSARRPVVGSPWQAKNRARCGVGPGEATLAPCQGQIGVCTPRTAGQ